MFKMPLEDKDYDSRGTEFSNPVDQFRGVYPNLRLCIYVERFFITLKAVSGGGNISGENSSRYCAATHQQYIKSN